MNEIVGVDDRGDDVRGPIKDCLEMLKKLFDKCRGVCKIDEDLSGITSKGMITPVDTLNILCNLKSQVQILASGKNGTAFVFANEAINDSKPFIFKIGIGLPYKVYEFYDKKPAAEIITIQRQNVPGGSLEQYMQSFHWLEGRPELAEAKARIDELVPKLIPIDNKPLGDMRCTLIIMEYVAGNSEDTPPWATAAGLPSRDEIKRQVDIWLKEAGVAHSDLDEQGNLLLDYQPGPPPTIGVKVIDFGQALPSGEIIISVGQSEGKPGTASWRRFAPSSSSSPFNFTPNPADQP